MEDYIYKTKEAEVEASVSKILETGRLIYYNVFLHFALKVTSLITLH